MLGLCSLALCVAPGLPLTRQLCSSFHPLEDPPHLLGPRTPKSGTGTVGSLPLSASGVDVPFTLALPGLCWVEWTAHLHSLQCSWGPGVCSLLCRMSLHTGRRWPARLGVSCTPHSIPKHSHLSHTKGEEKALRG